MTSKAYKARVTLSKEHLDIEVRNIVRKVSHRPVQEIVQIVRERTHSQIDENYLRALLAEFRPRA
ncbi:MAG: hypothetical protein RB191_02180 [Terriglobia bacterium]|nr:hypothetical protein [Terriglobia bacterium]